MTLVAALDYLSVFIFALSGALAASRAQLDLVGFLFIACITGLGGGTVRDLVLSRGEIVWIAQPGILLPACGAAVLVFFLAHRVDSRRRALDWADAGALSVAVPAGVGVALGMGHGPAVVLIAGMLTGAVGGMIRDVICNEIPLVLRQGELYLSAAFAGALAALGAVWIGVPQGAALILCAAVTFLLRAGSLIFGWRLPVYRSRPPKG